MANGIEFLLQLQDQFSAPLGKAEAAVSRLSNRLDQENALLGQLESKAQSAAAKLFDMSHSSDVKNLADELKNAKDRLDAIKTGKAPFSAAAYKEASNEVSRLGSKLDQAKAKQSQAVAKQVEVVQGLNKQTAAQRASRDAVQGALPQWQKWSQSLGANKEKLSELADQASQAGGPLGSLAGKAKSLAQLVGKGGAAGAIIVLVAVLAALVAGLVIAFVALSKFALECADAARSSALLSEAATGSAAGATELEKVVSQLTSKIPQARDKTAEWARQLALARIEGRDMQRVLTAMGMTAAAVGDGGAEKIRGIAEASRDARRFMIGARDAFGEFASLKGTGIKAADIYAALAKSMQISIPEAKRRILQGVVTVKQGLEALEVAAETKFGPIVARQMMSLDVQARKFKENISALFSGVNIEKFLAGLKTLTDLFDQNRVTGYVLREVITKAFTAIFDVASRAFPYIRAALMGVAFGVILVATWVKRAASWISEAFGKKSANDAERLKTMFALGAAAVGVVVGGIAALTLGIAALATTAALLTMPLWLPFVLGAVAVYAMYKAITAVVKGIGTAFDGLKSLDLSSIGANLINGLIAGIKSKIGAVGDAISSVAGAVKGAFTGEMEIHSPSRVMARYADNTVEGYTQQLEKRTPDAQIAIAGLGGGKPGEMDASSSSRAPPPVQFVHCTFGSSADETARLIEERIRISWLALAGGTP